MAEDEIIKKWMYATEDEEKKEVYHKRIIVPIELGSLDEDGNLDETRITKFNAIIDTGATETIISMKVGKKIRGRLTGRKIMLMGLGGGSLTGYEIDLHIHIPPNPFFKEAEKGLIKATVIQNLESWLDPAILIGMDFMEYETMKKIVIDLVDKEQLKVAENVYAYKHLSHLQLPPKTTVLVTTEAEAKDLCGKIERTDPIYFAGLAYKKESDEKELYHKAMEEVLPMMKKRGYVYTLIMKEGQKTQCPLCKKSNKWESIFTFHKGEDQFTIKAVEIHILCKHFEMFKYSKGKNMICVLEKFLADAKILEDKEFLHIWNGLEVEHVIEEFGLDDEDAKTLVEMLIKAEESKGGRQVEEAMEYANTVLNGHGVEALTKEEVWISHFFGHTIALYVNMGMTENVTIVYDTENNEFIVISWGEFLEQWENERKRTGQEEE